MAQPNVSKGQVVRGDDRLKRGVPSHSRRAVNLLVPGHQEAEAQAKVGNQRDCDLGGNTPGEVVVPGGDESTKKHGPVMENNAERTSQIG